MARQIPCSCTQIKVKENVVKKPAKTLEGIFPWMPVGVRNILSSASKAMGALGKVSGGKTVKTFLDSDGKKCEACGGKGSIDDPSDTSESDKKTAEKAQAAAKQIEALEAKMGPPGGNQHHLVVGNSMLEVGLGMNDTPSYEVIEEKSAAQNGHTITSKGTVPNSVKTNHVQGKNVLASSGGQYIIKCSNKFTVFTGAQGIELNTFGPVTIRGGITKIYGPEVSIGSSRGQTLIEGDHLQLTGKTINLTPDPGGKGQVCVQGTLTTNGNLITQGGAHIEGDLSFISATCPMKIDRTRTSGQIDQTTGGAVWSAQAAVQSMQDFARKWSVMAADPMQYASSPRGIISMMQDTSELVKKALPLEIVQTGWAVGVTTGASLVPIFNYPHHHTLPDMAHTHDMFVPNIRALEDDQAVRKSVAHKETIVPATAHKDSAIFTMFSAVGDTIKTMAAFLVSK